MHPAPPSGTLQAKDSMIGRKQRARQQEQPRLCSTEQRPRSPRKHIPGVFTYILGTKYLPKLCNRPKTLKLVTNTEISPEEPHEKRQSNTYVCMQVRGNKGPAAPSSTWDRATFKAPGVDSSSEIHWNGQEVPTIGTWASSHQWVNPVQHEG